MVTMVIQVKEIGYAGHFFDALRFDVHAMPHLEASEPVQEPNNTISFAGEKKAIKMRVSFTCTL